MLGAYNTNMLVFILLYAGALMTSLYMFRLYFLTFEGQPRSKNAKSAVESTVLMTGPLILLAVLSVFGGYHSLYPTSISEVLLDDIKLVADMPNHLWMIVLGTFAWVVGGLTARSLLREWN